MSNTSKTGQPEGNAMNNPLQLLSSSGLTMSSVEVAKLTGKLHKNVLADCRVLIVEYQKLYINQAADISALVISSTYKDANGDDQPAFNLSKQATLDLMTGYSLPMRHAVNKRWMELEGNQKPKTALQLAKEQVAILEELEQAHLKIESQQQAIAVLEPQAQALGRMEASEGAMNITNAAKVLKVQPSVLFRTLSSNRWIYKRAGGKAWVGYQDKIQAGYLDVVFLWAGVRGIQYPKGESCRHDFARVFKYPVAL